MIKELLANLKERKRERDEMMRNAKSREKIEQILEKRKMSANERELNRYIKEDREKRIKEMLEAKRREREAEATYSHNPINVPNVVHDDPMLFRHKQLFIADGNTIFSSKNRNNLFFR